MISGDLEDLRSVSTRILTHASQWLTPQPLLHPASPLSHLHLSPPFQDHSVAVLADIFSQTKEGCVQAEAVVARMTLDSYAYATRVELTSVYASQQHKDAAKCGAVPEPPETAAASAALEARQQGFFDKLNSLRSFSA